MICFSLSGLNVCLPLLSAGRSGERGSSGQLILEHVCSIIVLFNISVRHSLFFFFFVIPVLTESER